MARTRRTVVRELVEMGWNQTIANLAYGRWGVSAWEILRQDPYAVLFLQQSFRWQELDQIAQSLGFDEKSLERTFGAIRHALFSSTNDGHVCLPYPELLSRVSRLIHLEEEDEWQTAFQGLVDRREIVQQGNSQDGNSYIYLHNLFQSEHRIASSLVQLNQAASRMALQVPSDADLKNVENELRIELAPAQKEAIRASLSNKMAIITGGPGTGKTTIIRGVLYLWYKRGAQIKLAAPTGRAAKRLAESTNRKAFTIHRLLEYDPDSGQFMRNANRKLKVDLLVVDESSMIDTELMAALLEALPPFCHLLVVGDVDQLPSVGPGSILHDLIECGHFQTIHLSQIFRQQDGSLISSNARKINMGEMPVMDSGGVEQGQDFFFISRTSPAAVRDAILEMVTERIPRQFGFDPKEQIQILCPMIKRDVGVEAMNALLQTALNQSDVHFKAPFYTLSPGDKIMQTKNDYSKDVFNGDIGFVKSVNSRKKTVLINFDGNDIDYEWEELENTSLAYAVTVHKSQGSEYPAVVIPLVKQHFPMLQRNLLYTAVSRGKQLVILAGEPQALQIAIQNNKTRKRYTGLKILLEEAFAKIEKSNTTNHH